MIFYQPYDIPNPMSINITITIPACILCGGLCPANVCYGSGFGQRFNQNNVSASFSFAQPSQPEPVRPTLEESKGEWEMRLLNAVDYEINSTLLERGSFSIWVNTRNPRQGLKVRSITEVFRHHAVHRVNGHSDNTERLSFNRLISLCREEIMNDLTQMYNENKDTNTYNIQGVVHSHLEREVERYYTKVEF